MTTTRIPPEIHGHGRFLIHQRDFVPAYLLTHEKGLMKQKVDEALALLGPPCEVCPRKCPQVNRIEGARGFCGISRHVLLACAFPHYGEEDVLRGDQGSGTLFFSGCNLRCVFCQNADISREPEGHPIEPRCLAKMMVSLQRDGCHNINLVTPEHVVPQVIEAIPHAISLGLRIPLVYNTSGYDSLKSLQVLDGIIDIYMPDFKLWDEGASATFLQAKNYPVVARDSIREMHRQVGDMVVNEYGIAMRGLLVRHLLLPGRLDDTRQILQWLASLSRDTYVNLMDQYRPANLVPLQARFSALNRKINPAEVTQAIQMALRAGLWRLDDRWRKN